ncbi:MAG: glycine cleavage system aminomethyltransferase GcvT [Longimicrobiales bacterium]
MRETPLHDVHRALGANLVEFGGWHMPVQYGPILDEVRLVREHVGLFDLSHMGRLRITGPDAVAFVDRVATCFCAKIPIGAIRYGLLCREDGNPIDDLLVYRGEHEVFLVVNASNSSRDLAWLQEHAAGFEVEIEDQTNELAMLALQGSGSEAALGPLLEGLDLSSIGYYRFGAGTLCGIPDVRVSRTGYTGEDGFEIYFPAAETERVWTALLEAGEPVKLAPIGLGARDTLRLEAGMALFGHEIDESHNPIEAGLSFGVSFHEDKGDWIGREALAQIKANPTRALVGITTDGKRVPRQGYALWSGDEKVGEICSGAVSPTIGKNIGTGYLPVSLAKAGVTVDMELRGKRQPCIVVDLPFYSRTRNP